MNTAFLPDSVKENFFVSTELHVPEYITDANHEESDSDGESLHEELHVPKEVLALAMGVEAKEALEQQRDTYWRFIATSANSAIPLGWMPLGLAQVMEGRILLALQSFLGLAALSGLALLLGYRSTLRFYTTPPTARSRPTNRGRQSTRPTLGQRLVDCELPVLEKTTSALAINSLLTLLRHPSVWAQLSAPVFLMWILYMAYANLEHIDSTLLRGLITNMSSTMVIMLPFFGTITFFTNMFGLDVGGFRAYVLLPAPRWKYLLGFNIVVFSIPAFFAVVLLCLASMLIPYSAGELFISVLQIIQIGLTLCIVGNVISILFPYHLDMHNFRPSLKQQFTLIFAAFLVMGTLGLLSIPVAFSLLIDSFLTTFLGYEGISIGILTSIAMIVLVAVVYWAILPALGGFLQSREIKILETLSRAKS
jgi:hypothetical protein